ncbi:MAG: hypothetical protein JSW07_22185 [bacterium]|nr:MAG: hypothetical protein JSW07_22185 [bacterium]
MALSKLSRDSTWRAGFQGLTLSESNFDVVLQDHNTNHSLSLMDLKIVSTANYNNISKTIELLMAIPPNLGDLAVFCTDTIMNVTVTDEFGNPDSSLFIENALDMLPFDKDGLVALAASQGHVYAGDFVPTDGYPNNDFYYDFDNGIPNVTHVNGDFTVNGGTTVYGIFVVEGNADLNGSARLEGVVYLPNPESIIINGSGDPNEAAVTGGIVVNGSVDGAGNHIDIQYNSEYMHNFAAFQTDRDPYIISWTESPDA